MSALSLPRGLGGSGRALPSPCPSARSLIPHLGPLPEEAPHLGDEPLSLLPQLPLRAP